MIDTWVIVFDNGSYHCSVGHGHETQELREARTYPSKEDAERDASTLEGVALCDTLARMCETTPDLTKLSVAWASYRSEMAKKEHDEPVDPWMALAHVVEAVAELFGDKEECDGT